MPSIPNYLQFPFFCKLRDQLIIYSVAIWETQKQYRGKRHLNNFLTLNMGPEFGKKELSEEPELPCATPFQSHSPPTPASANRGLFSISVVFLLLRMSLKWNCAVCNFLRLTSSILHNIFTICCFKNRQFVHLLYYTLLSVDPLDDVWAVSSSWWL